MIFLKTLPVFLLIAASSHQGVEARRDVRRRGGTKEKSSAVPERRLSAGNCDSYGSGCVVDNMDGSTVESGFCRPDGPDSCYSVTGKGGSNQHCCTQKDFDTPGSCGMNDCFCEDDNGCCGDDSYCDMGKCAKAQKSCKKAKSTSTKAPKSTKSPGRRN